MSGGKEALCIANKMMLEDMLKFKNVEVLLETKVSSISNNAVEVITPDGEKSCPSDTVILATGYAANNNLYKEINSNIPKKVWLLGDAKAPSNIMYAVKDGAAVGKIL
jgi:2-enoate reductase